MIQQIAMGLAGGVLIGLAAGVLMLFSGRIAGVSGIASGLLARPDLAWLENVCFVVGLPLGAAVYMGQGGHLSPTISDNTVLLCAAGLLVGFGSRLGNGCTSGHAVCGLARFSYRSLWATGIFMAFAFVTVAIARHL